MEQRIKLSDNTMTIHWNVLADDEIGPTDAEALAELRSLIETDPDLAASRLKVVDVNEAEGAK